MADGGEARRAASGLGLPLGLLLAVLASVAGVVMWLSVESPEVGESPAVGTTIALGRQDAADPPGEEPGPARPEAAAPPASPPVPPPAVEPTYPPPEQAARGDRAEPPPLPPQFRLPRVASGPPLPAAPDPALVEQSPMGPLPVIGPDGREPWRVYARPFDASDGRPRIAIVVTGLGRSGAPTAAAIEGLPGAVTLAFVPYAPRLQEWCRLARAAGHEVLLDLPMEPENFPEFDPGPQALLTSLSDAENGERLSWTLSRATGYVGVADFMVSRFTMSRSHLGPVLAALNRRGLLFLDSRTARQSVAAIVAREVGIPFASNTMFIDASTSREAIDARLAELEGLAKADGKAVGMATPYPLSLERIAAWSATLAKRGIALAPVSALAGTRAGG